MEVARNSRKSMSASAAIGLALPPVLLALLVFVYVGTSSYRLNGLDAGVLLLIGAPLCIVLGMICSIYAVTEDRGPRWAAISGLVVNGLLFTYAFISLLLAA